MDKIGRWLHLKMLSMKYQPIAIIIIAALLLIMPLEAESRGRGHSGGSCSGYRSGGHSPYATGGRHYVGGTRFSGYRGYGGFSGGSQVPSGEYWRVAEQRVYNDKPVKDIVPPDGVHMHQQPDGVLWFGDRPYRSGRQ